MPSFEEYEKSNGKCVWSKKVTALKETDAAILVRFEDGIEAWIPKSQIDDDSEVYAKGHEGTLVITYWLAGQKGWI